jgi:two-component system, OmpR family, phosphate regulon sensor histidine kinase PhoR
MAIWLRFCLLIFLSILTSAVAWKWLGFEIGLIVFSLLVLALLLRSITQIARLWRVLEHIEYGKVPSAMGLWGEVYYRLHHAVKQWHERAANAEQEHLRFIEAIQASPNGVLILDNQDQIDWFNHVAALHLGLSSPRDLGQRITHLIRDPSFVNYLRQQIFDESLTMRNAGEYRKNIVSIQIFPCNNDRKLLLTQDITRIEKTETMRRDFVANVSHELKTPLTVLMGFLETVRDVPLENQVRDYYLGLMHAQAMRMQTLVEDLLILARIEADNRPPIEDELDMQCLCEQILHEAHILSAGQHDIDLVCTPDINLRGNTKELHSAFGNLVSNAVRYTPKGGRIILAWVPVSYLPKFNDHSNMTWNEKLTAFLEYIHPLHVDPEPFAFAVLDTGPGIEASHLPRITERFYPSSNILPVATMLN